mmetsp:Transcript_10859/g.17079  ORF Transcript_10859/g.17079 Transcript_10859/m.17079 type:complete len:223 (+) Transcript_10859:2134-2802(+)
MNSLPSNRQASVTVRQSREEVKLLIGATSAEVTTSRPRVSWMSVAQIPTFQQRMYVMLAGSTRVGCQHVLGATKWPGLRNRGCGTALPALIRKIFSAQGREVREWMLAEFVTVMVALVLVATIKGRYSIFVECATAQTQHALDATRLLGQFLTRSIDVETARIRTTGSLERVMRLQSKIATTPPLHLPLSVGKTAGASWRARTLIAAVDVAVPALTTAQTWG